jgi:endoglucanase
VGLVHIRSTVAALLALGCLSLGSAPAGATQSSASASHVRHLARHRTAKCGKRHPAATRARSSSGCKARTRTHPSKVARRHPPAPGGGTSAANGAPGNAAPTPETEASPAKEAPSAKEAPPAKSTPASSNPFAEQRFYVNPSSPAVQTEREWRAAGRASEAAEIAKIASQPTAEWFGDWSYGHGGTEGDVNWWVGEATAAGTLPVLVAYDLPWRDCSGESGGGAASPTAYKQFVDEMAAGIGDRKAVVIVEPDALAELTCLSAGRQDTYYELLTYAVRRLTTAATVSVYLDAGNSGWQPAATIAARLRKADVAGARGFSLNISNFYTSAAEEAYGAEIDRGLPSAMHFIIDTSRNGQGPAAGDAWCNPSGRGLGTAPTAQTGNPLVDAFFWVKQPGASDGTCNGGPSAGTWWPGYALGLAQNADW